MQDTQSVQYVLVMIQALLMIEQSVLKLVWAVLSVSLVGLAVFAGLLSVGSRLKSLEETIRFFARRK